jgi:hypothetical protein
MRPSICCYTNYLKASLPSPPAYEGSCYTFSCLEYGFWSPPCPAYSLSILNWGRIWDIKFIKYIMHCTNYISLYVLNKVQKCWPRRMNVRWHIPVVLGLLIDGAQLNRQTLHKPCSPTKFTQIFFTDTAPELPTYCNNHTGWTSNKMYNMRPVMSVFKMHFTVKQHMLSNDQLMGHSVVTKGVPSSAWHGVLSNTP